MLGGVLALGPLVDAAGVSGWEQGVSGRDGWREGRREGRESDTHTCPGA